MARISIAAIFLLASLTAQADVPRAATVVSLAGKVRVSRSGQDVALGVNDPVYAGDTIATSDNGSVKMLFTDDSIMDLGPQSNFKIEQFAASGPGDRTGVFSILYGRLRALVSKAIGPQSKLEVRTADAVMGVRGTELVVSTPPSGGKTELTVVTGNVAMSMPRTTLPPISVGAGAQAVASLGMTGTPHAVPLSAAGLAGLTQTARVRDNTFERTVSMDAGVQNDKAPPAATPKALASGQVSAAKENASDKSSESATTKAVGAFSSLNMISDVPVTLIPAGIQTVTVRLAH